MKVPPSCNLLCPHPSTTLKYTLYNSCDNINNEVNTKLKSSPPSCDLLCPYPSTTSKYTLYNSCDKINIE